jgi:arylsulfatase A-like enzyme
MIESKKKTPLLAASLLMIMLAFACSPEPAADRNVILITLDTQRADHVGAYGRNLADTPNMDHLAAGGILVQDCYSPIPITLPAHLSLFYSQMPHELGIYNNGEKFKQNELMSLAEMFKDRGYSTAAFVSLGVLKKNFGVQEGFVHYRDDFLDNRWYLTAEEINSRALPWLKTHSESPFFAWIHYSDPHDPYAPPDLEPDLTLTLNGEKVGEYCLQKNRAEELKLNLNKGTNTLQLKVNARGLEIQDLFPARFTRFELESTEGPAVEMEFSEEWKRTDIDKPMVFMPQTGTLSITGISEGQPVLFRFQGKLNLRHEENRVLYRKEVEYLDRNLGVLFRELKQMGLWDDSLIVLVGDHGEGLGEYPSDKDRPQYGHLHYLYSPYVKVPLIFHSPGHKKSGASIGGRTTLLDVAPTILGLLGWKKPAGMSGHDVLDSSLPDRQDIQLETFLPQAYFDRISLIRGSEHLILTPQLQKYELYDLSEEDLERTDLYDSRADRPYIKLMVRELNALARQVLTEKAQQVQESDAQEILRSLGYIK